MCVMEVSTAGPAYMPTLQLLLNPAGLLTGHKIIGVRMVLEDGVSHGVDSSELAFRLAAVGAMRQGELPSCEHGLSEEVPPPLPSLPPSCTCCPGAHHVC